MDRNMSIERMKYQDNKISYTLGLIAFLINNYYLIISLNNMKLDTNVGIEVLSNLIMYLFLFLGIEKVKTYSKIWSYITVFIGVTFILRIFWIPSNLREIGKVSAANKATISLLIGGILIILSGMIGIMKITKIDKYLYKLHSEKNQ